MFKKVTENLHNDKSVLSWQSAKVCVLHETRMMISCFRITKSLVFQHVSAIKNSVRHSLNSSKKESQVLCPRWVRVMISNLEDEGSASAWAALLLIQTYFRNRITGWSDFFFSSSGEHLHFMLPNIVQPDNAGDTAGDTATYLFGRLRSARISITKSSFRVLLGKMCLGQEDCDSKSWL